MKIQNIFYLFPILLLLSSCSNKPEFEQYHKFDNNTWNRFKLENFEFPVTDPEQEYDVYFIFRYLPEYPEKKFKFVFTTYKPSGEMRSSEHKIWTISNDGKYQGEDKGEYIELKTLVSEEISFPETGIAKFEIENKATKFNTPGIYEVGIIIEKSKEKDTPKF